jgi:enterochelin esterase-like enzyme
LILFVNGYSQSIIEGKVIAQNSWQNPLKITKEAKTPMRSVSVYLPPGYDETNQRYPTIYFLHGVSTNDSEMFTWLGLKDLMDKAIASGRMRPMILVVPNSYNLYRGSFYTNSTLIGNWADFIGKDVVAFADKNFRTIAKRSSRGLAGHSMGGNGALKIAMLFPEVFNAVYA